MLISNEWAARIAGRPLFASGSGVGDSPIEERRRKPQEWDVGGLIALDREGNAAMPFNSEGMYRGFITDKGDVSVKIDQDR